MVGRISSNPDNWHCCVSREMSSLLLIWAFRLRSVYVKLACRSFVSNISYRSLLCRFPRCTSILKRCFLCCSRILFISPCKTTCERLMRLISSQSSSTDPILWVENMIVAPLSLISRISCFNRLALTGSKPLNGSSKISSLGLCITVVINCIFCCIPFESSSIFFFSQPFMSNLFSQYFMPSLASFFDNPFN